MIFYNIVNIVTIEYCNKKIDHTIKVFDEIIRLNGKPIGL